MDCSASGGELQLPEPNLESVPSGVRRPDLSRQQCAVPLAYLTVHSFPITAPALAPGGFLVTHGPGPHA